MASTTMRAVVLDGPGGPERFTLRDDVPIPSPRAHEVLLRVAGCGIGHRDVMARQGFGVEPVVAGMVLGGELSGEVAAVGADVSDVSVGDRVACRVHITCGRCWYCVRGEEASCEVRQHTEGGYGEYTTVPAACLVRLPDGVPIETGAILGAGVASALSAVRDVGRCRLGDAVLVTGAGGGVGIHAIQIARLCGARVIALTSSAHKRDALAGFDVDAVVLSHGAWHESVLALTDGRGVDLAIDTVGGPVVPEVVASMAVRGRLVMVGDVQHTPFELKTSTIVRRALTIVGSKSWHRHHLEETVALVADGRLRACIGRRGGLGEVADIHRDLEASRVVGRALLLPNGEWTA